MVVQDRLCKKRMKAKAGAVGDWSETLLVRENKRKPQDPRFTPTARAILKKKALAGWSNSGFTSHQGII